MTGPSPTRRRVHGNGASRDGEAAPGNGTATLGAANDAAPTYVASLFPGRAAPLPAAFAISVRAIEQSLGLPVWLLIHGSAEPFEDLDEPLYRLVRSASAILPPETGVALLIDSPGGQARSAYQVGSFLRRRCGHYVAVIPRYAKSAATLLTLGAKQIVMGEFAELGPLDVQILDLEREDMGSALNEVSALDRLTAVSLESVDQLMMFLRVRTGKRVETLLPHITRFVAETLRPLYEKIDTVHYTQTSRLLKVAEEYAIRLLLPYYPATKAASIARHLIEHYPAHDYVIDREEALANDLPVTSPSDEIAAAFEDLLPFLESGMTAIGRVEEVQP